jgi:hypothetical protein
MAFHANQFWIFNTAAAEYCFEQKIAKSRGNFTIKGKNRACLEIRHEPMPVSSFPLRSSVKWLGKASAHPT